MSNWEATQIEAFFLLDSVSTVDLQSLKSADVLRFSNS